MKWSLSCLSTQKFGEYWGQHSGLVNSKFKHVSESTVKLLEKLILNMMSRKKEQKPNYFPDLIKLGELSFGLYTICRVVTK